MQKRAGEFAEGMLSRGVQFWWNAFIETHSILQYKPKVLDDLAASGMYIAEIGAEAGTDEQMKLIGKPIQGDDNIAAAVEMDRRGVCSSVTYIIGYPGEEADSMLATIDQCRRLHVAAPLARPTVWPYRPIPGTAMWDQAIELGYQPPTHLEEWGSIGEYHLEETWPGKIPPNVAQMRKLYQHYVTLSYGLARGKIGWWERRAERRLRENDFRLGMFEARAFDVYNRVERKLFPRVEVSRSLGRPGAQDGHRRQPGVRVVRRDDRRDVGALSGRRDRESDASASRTSVRAQACVPSRCARSPSRDSGARAAFVQRAPRLVGSTVRGVDPTRSKVARCFARHAARREASPGARRPCARRAHGDRAWERSREGPLVDERPSDPTGDPRPACALSCSPSIPRPPNPR